MGYYHMDYIKLWQEFSDVPINSRDEIEERFLHFEKGTDKIDIWSWFDQKLPKGIAYELCK